MTHSQWGHQEPNQWRGDSPPTYGSHGQPSGDDGPPGWRAPDPGGQYPVPQNRPESLYGPLPERQMQHRSYYQGSHEPAPSRTNKTGLIIGLIVAGFVLIGLIMTLLIWVMMGSAL